ncbi:MAG: ribosome-associated heat shock protein Hsp15 [Gammaproteobacteria bacterium]|uniref:ribosome-associated heat shock protein Hsp15 n=1 Tax=Marisediminitalea aggregata TaxID=634436 RepID=UPI003371BFBC|nr:ribosome-associated heat shock protein Hsp15 [Gammaproteobacteria bacterium]MCP3862321.1 ribosome-associated heat shock protein Hsp15 [Aestuariibacter sp.]MCP4525655.1 ribosome-associated heat shock protein Hsp15 [Aestuariibacter sp.]MCP4949619.1 ribosome-associated heat shock protein Hsp15 [Aestuariibacter sp.]MCP5010411.1 ribosome-associated heat shock protein Hsp15 [Aestuariibacter sp.]
MPMINDNNTTSKVRLDKWIWAARLTKTRALARDLIQAGKVHYNGQKSKPGKIVELGALIRVPAGWDVKEVEVTGIEEKRQPAKLAELMYQETADSVAKREQNQLARKMQTFHSPKPENRPDKKQRRELIKFKHQ